jgi:hypothetical protein
MFGLSTKRRLDVLESRVAALSVGVDMLRWSMKYGHTVVGPTTPFGPLVESIDLAKHIGMIQEFLGVERVVEPAREYLRKKEVPA